MYTNNKQFINSWAIILGGSSGFGFAAVEKLAASGMNIAVLYRETAAEERALKGKFVLLQQDHQVTIAPFNLNALDKEGRDLFLQQFTAIVDKTHCVKLLLHSIARGNLKPLFIPGDEHDSIAELSVEDIQYTSYAMSTSMLDWARLLIKANLFEPDARIIGLTSEGAHKYWEGYAAVSIAKSSLGSLCKYMAVELGKFGLKTNVIQAGITKTPSLKKIPGSGKLLEYARTRNPLGRVTKPEDVANVVHLLCTAEAAWINGSLIHVDGGEHCR